MVKFVIEYEDSTQSALSLHQLRILHEIKVMGPQTAVELVEGLHESDPNQARVLLRKLVDAGALEMHGERRGAYYVRRTK